MKIKYLLKSPIKYKLDYTKPFPNIKQCDLDNHDSKFNCKTDSYTFFL